MRSNDRLVTRLRMVRSYRTSELYRSNAYNALETARWAGWQPHFREREIVEKARRALAENDDWLAGNSYPAERPLSLIN